MPNFFYLFFVFLFASLLTKGQVVSLDDWDEIAKTDVRLLPKYGNIKKNNDQKNIDWEFIKEVMEIDAFKGNRNLASDYYIQLGFEQLSKDDLKTAMYRFNQGYLLDSLNSNIYLGYGAVFLKVKNIEKAKNEFLAGLHINSEHPDLLANYADCLIHQYFLISDFPLSQKQRENSFLYVDSALDYLNRSYQINPNNSFTLSKLTMAYYIKEDCTQSLKFYDEYKKSKQKFLDSEFINILEKTCIR
ncbi:hypothetical protein O2K51_01400 [Apibacter raozihei]|uniref:hypothetical protein n=1 Tax=Apibacter raozihei TaxID=2500547 RepID=UPI000FE435B7|nr:hypothetical protein [Apibacter raozihei]